MSSTNTYTSAPTCENCGRDKQATYICDPCCDKLNAMHRDLLAERDGLAAERDELQRRLVEVVAALKPAQIKWSKASMDSPEYHAWCLVVPLYAQAVAIAEGRNNG